MQLKDFFGLTVATMPEHYLGKVGALAAAAAARVRWPDLAIGAVHARRPHPLAAGHAQGVPAPLIAPRPRRHPGRGCWARFVPGFEVATIGSASRRWSRTASRSSRRCRRSPGTCRGPDGRPLVLSFDLIRELIPSAFAIAMLGAIESLLSAVVADGMTGDPHDPDAELVAQGIGNIVAPFFGGIAATGALARTATNIRSGARSPLAAIFHSLFVLAGGAAPGAAPRLPADGRRSPRCC